MGADIHATIEVRRYGNWVGFATDVKIGRDYGLFGVLAHVRRDDVAMVGHVGLPADLSWEHREFIQREGDDWHSHGWVLFSELPVRLSGDHLFYDVMRVIAERCGSDNVRLVFAFDS